MKKFVPMIISVFLVIVNVLQADASENILRGVDVTRSGGNYVINLTSTAPANMTKTIVSANRIIINLKDIGVSSNLVTKFDGNSVIDNVIVEPNGRNNANIMIQGNKIAYSDVVFKEPGVMANAQDTIVESFISLADVLTGASGDKTVQFGILGVFLFILVAEIRFIRSKYNEFKLEKQQVISEMKRTENFQDYLPGYGNAGLKKPYTTPLYGKARMVNSVSGNVNLPKFMPSETVTLNNLLKSSTQEKTLINKIINNKPVFGSLSNINVGDNVPKNMALSRAISNPIPKAKLKANLDYLEGMTDLYNSTTSQEVEKEFRSRLNKIY